MTNDLIDECRVAFEKWANAKFHNPVKRADGGYNFTGALEAWNVWQEAWKARAPKEQPYRRERYCDEPGRGY